MLLWEKIYHPLLHLFTQFESIMQLAKLCNFGICTGYLYALSQLMLLASTLLAR